MQIWSQAAILEKNKLANDAPFLILVEVTHPSLPEPIRLVSNTDDISWNKAGWTAFPLTLDTYEEDGKTTPQLTLKISACGGIVTTYLQQYSGLVDAEAKIMVVHAAHLDETTPEVELDFLVNSTSYDEEWVSFVLGLSSASGTRFPRWRYLLDFCPYKFGDIRCGYSGAAAACQNNLKTCRIPSRFGGEPGMPTT